MSKLEFFTDPVHAAFTFGEGQVGALLVHGFGGTPADIWQLGRRLGEMGCTAYGPSLPGFARDIARLEKCGREDWLVAVRETWQRVRAAHPTTILIGYSMGGALALHAAVEHPPDRLVLLAPFTRLRGLLVQLVPLARHFRKNYYPYENADFSDPSLRQDLATIAPGADLDDPAVQQALRQQVRIPLDAVHELMQLGKNALRLAPEVQAPTLVVQGKQDPTVKAEDTRTLVRQMPAGTLYHEIDANHHLSQGNAPYHRQVFPLVLDFLGDVLKD
ncbi:MAG: alpha/beta fold hydrolase [Anaerolineae bacterium]|nr:alpha/beta fold hydrolase [Anaerolineae bacterium]